MTYGPLEPYYMYHDGQLLKYDCTYERHKDLCVRSGIIVMTISQRHGLCLC